MTKNIHAWQMIVVKQGTPVGDVQKMLREKERWAMEVMGPYDAVSVLYGDSLEGIYHQAKNINKLDVVASSTTYVSVRTEIKRESHRPVNCCLLLEVSPDLQEHALEAIKEMADVLRVDIILGPFDMVVLTNTELTGMRELLGKIRKTKGVLRTMPMYALP